MLLVPNSISSNIVEVYVPSLLDANVALHSLYSLEQAFTRSVLVALNRRKICIDPQWLCTQNYEYETIQNEVRDGLNAGKGSNLSSIEHDFIHYMELNGLYFTKDLQQLDALSTIHPVYSKFKKFIKAQQFHRQWVEKLTPYYSKMNNRLELTGHWRSFASYTGRITASKLPLTSMPNKMKQWVIPSKSDYSIWSIDLSNAELRFLSLYSKDEQLTDDLNNGRDIHSLVGTLFQQNLSYTGDEPNHRKAAKTFIFAMLYGAGNFRLGESLRKHGYDIQSDDVNRIKKTVFSRYASLEGYFKSVEESEIVGSFYGPILPLITLKPNQKRNFALQSSISTAIKLLAFEVTRMNLEIVHIIHDELWIQVPDSNHCSWQKDLTENFSRILLSHHSNFPVMGLLDIKKNGGITND